MSAILSAQDSLVPSARAGARSGAFAPVWSSGAFDGPVPNLTTSRASNATYTNALGALVTAGNNVSRIDFDPVSKVPKGLLVEESRTNYLLNSASPATQTVSLGTGTYTLWVNGSGSCACAAGTATGSGFGTATASTAKTFTVTGAGTVMFTVSGSLTRYQCENGTFATSFITTTGAAATRAADICSVPLGSWFTASAMTVALEFLKSVHDTTHNYGPMYLSDGGNNNSTSVYVDSGTAQVVFGVATGAATQVSLGLSTLDAGKPNLSCGSYALNDCRVGYNGNLTMPDTSVTPPTLTILHLGNRFDGLRALNGWIRHVTIYAGRLPDDALVALSNPQ